MSTPSPDLSHLLKRVLADYPEEQVGEGLSTHETRTDIEDRIPARLRELINDTELIITGSVGKGRWTSIPWVAIMDPQETSRTQEGLYIVYLFEPQEGRVRLSLGLGVTELKNELGLRKAREILEARAERLRTEIDLPGFSPGPVEFPHASNRNKLYGTGTVYYKEYSLDEIPEERILTENIHRLADVYSELIPTSNDYTPDDEPPSPAGAYGSIEATLSDLRQRVVAIEEDFEWFERHLGKALISDWSEALIGFNPSDDVSASIAARYDQLRAVYEELEPELRARADKWGVGTLQNLTPAQTLFLGCVRILYEDAEIDGAPLSQPRFNSILNDTYGIVGAGETPSTESTHMLTTQLEEGECAVYKVTAPPDYWLTAYAYACLGFETSDQETWDKIEPGDVIVFHSTGEPGWEKLANQSPCLLGAGIVQAKPTKPTSTKWWFDEEAGRPKEDTFPYLVAFERLFVTGAIDEIDLGTDIRSKSLDLVDSELRTLTRDGMPIGDADSISNEISNTGFPTHRFVQQLNPLKRGKAIVSALAGALTEMPPVAVHRSFDGTIDADRILQSLYFPDDQGEEIVAQIEGALRAGKHTILTGPPGTGKTEIAQRVAKYLEREYPYLYSGSQMTTATADWSTFDTVGGYMPNEDASNGSNLEFMPGLVLNRFKQRSTNTQRNEPLVVDELNRADIDKAFGQLFTVLSGQAVQLPYTKDGYEVELAPADRRSIPAPHEYHIPDSWALFATLNTYDKTSLYEMSYAFMRRFAFIRVPEPPLQELDTAGLHEQIDAYATSWNIETAAFESPSDVEPLLDVAFVWKAANGAIENRAIGPAVVKDIIGYLSETTDITWDRRLTQAVISYIFPQLEGVPKRDRVVRNLAAVEHIDVSILDTAARDMLQVSATQGSNE